MKDMIMKYRTGCVVSWCVSLVGAVAGIELPAFFNDGMVLQRDMEIPVWGEYSGQEKKVRVSFAGQKEVAEVVDGKWKVSLSALAAHSEGRELEVKAGKDRQVIKDVLVGEVWLCSGQSNMDFPLRKFVAVTKEKNKPYEATAHEVNRIVKATNDPLLRQFMVKYKDDEFSGEWNKAQDPHILEFTGTGFFFAQEIRRELGVPVGLIKSAVSSTRIQPWMPESAYRSSAERSKYYDQQMKSAEARGDLRNNQNPTFLYHRLIEPLIPFGMRGAIWYQGEANTFPSNLPNAYAEYMEAMITAWREKWGQGDFPFYYVQISNCKEIKEVPVEQDYWATIQNQQRLAMKVPNTGMAVINDIGQLQDVHPINKMDTGSRLARWALAHDYGHEGLIYSGPLTSEVEWKGRDVVITFDHVGDGLMTGSKELHAPVVKVKEPVGSFQICGADRVWKWAQAEIMGKDQVVVRHEEVESPVEVRYAWAINPYKANLYNSEGLPTSVFKVKKGE